MEEGREGKGECEGWEEAEEEEEVCANVKHDYAYHSEVC